MLAGDWTVDNLQTAMTQVQPEWVAIATAVVVDGVKDLALLSQLVTIAHQINIMAIKKGTQFNAKLWCTQKVKVKYFS